MLEPNRNPGDEMREFLARMEERAANRDTPISERDLERTKTIHNERTKLTAGAINTTSVALFGGGFVLPLVSLSFPLASAPPPGPITLIAMVVWALVAIALHWWSRTMLGDLK